MSPRFCCRNLKTFYLRFCPHLATWCKNNHLKLITSSTEEPVMKHNISIWVSVKMLQNLKHGGFKFTINPAAKKIYTS